MTNVNERNLKIGQEVFVISRWCLEPSVASAIVEEIDCSENHITVVIHGKQKKYKLEDYGIFIFSSRETAQRALEKIPSKLTKLYQTVGTRVYKKKINGIAETCSGIYQDIVLEFDRGEPVSIKQIGKTLFYTREQAVQEVKQ